jgi:hypothetical protein
MPEVCSIHEYAPTQGSIVVTIHILHGYVSFGTLLPHTAAGEPAGHAQRADGGRAGRRLQRRA